MNFINGNTIDTVGGVLGTKADAKAEFISFFGNEDKVEELELELAA